MHSRMRTHISERNLNYSFLVRVCARACVCVYVCVRVRLEAARESLEEALPSMRNEVIQFGIYICM